MYNRRRQSGQIILGLVIALGLVITAIFGMYSAWFGDLTSAARKRTLQAYVQTAASAISQWYRTHPLAMDGTAQPMIPGCASGTPNAMTTCLLTAAGVPPRYGVEVDVGALQVLTGAGYAWRTLTVWIPKPNVAGVARNTFVVSKAFVYAPVDGQPIERSNWVEANAAVAGIARMLDAGYGAFLNSEQNAAADWFEPPGCGTSNGINAELSCANAWTGIGQAGLAQAIGWSGPTTDPWGDPIEVCNAAGCGANDMAPPYQFAVRVVQPWIDPSSGLPWAILQIATEPLAS